MRDKGESGWLSAIYHVIHEGLLISQAALRQRLVSRRYPLPETGNPFVRGRFRLVGFSGPGSHPDYNYKGALFSERVIANHAIRPLHLPVFG